LNNSTAGYDLAKANLKSPLDSLDRGSERKELYEIYCISCHGGTGNGKVN
jgi:cytochrome c